MISEARLDRAAVEIAADFTADLVALGMEPIHAELEGIELLSELLYELRTA
jgi:hypothetical protein